MLSKLMSHFSSIGFAMRMKDSRHTHTNTHTLQNRRMPYQQLGDRNLFLQNINQIQVSSHVSPLFCYLSPKWLIVTYCIIARHAAAAPAITQYLASQLSAIHAGKRILQVHMAEEQKQRLIDSQRGCVTFNTSVFMTECPFELLCLAA